MTEEKEGIRERRETEETEETEERKQVRADISVLIVKSIMV